MITTSCAAPVKLRVGNAEDLSRIRRAIILREQSAAVETRVECSRAAQHAQYVADELEALARSLRDRGDLLAKASDRAGLRVDAATRLLDAENKNDPFDDMAPIDSFQRSIVDSGGLSVLVGLIEIEEPRLSESQRVTLQDLVIEIGAVCNSISLARSLAHHLAGLEDVDGNPTAPAASGGEGAA